MSSISHLFPILLGGQFARDTTYALVVDDLNDGSGPAGERTGREEHDTADLDESPVAGGPVWRDVLATISIAFAHRS